MYARSGSGVGANKDASAKKPGQIVFENQGCTKCHSLTEGGEPGAEGGRGPGGKGPNLAKVGANHDKTWIAEHIRNAKTHKPMSRMPEYPEAKLNEKDLNTLAEYLAGLK
jgi:cbb3-type cytochrome oxidase cytochrome c subunit